MTALLQAHTSELPWNVLADVHGGEDDIEFGGVDAAVEANRIDDEARLYEAPTEMQDISVPAPTYDPTAYEPPTAESFGVEAQPQQYDATAHEQQARDNIAALGTAYHTETGTMYMDAETGGSNFNFVDAASGVRTNYQVGDDGGATSQEIRTDGGVARDTSWTALGDMRSRYVDDVGSHDVTTDRRGLTVHELVRHGDSALERTTSWSERDADGRNITSRIVEDGRGNVVSEFATPTEQVRGTYGEDGRAVIGERHSDGVSLIRGFGQSGEERAQTTVHGADMTPFNLTRDQAHALATGSGDDGVLASIPDGAHAALEAHQRGDAFALTAGHRRDPASLPTIDRPLLPPGVFLTNVPGLTISNNPPTGDVPSDPVSTFMQLGQGQLANGTTGSGFDWSSAFRVGQTINPVINAGQRIASVWTGHNPMTWAPAIAQVGVAWGAASDIAAGRNPLDNLITNEDKAMAAVYAANAAQTVTKGLGVVQGLGPTMSRLTPSLVGTAAAVGTLYTTNYTPAKDFMQSLGDAGVVVLPSFAGGPLGSAVVTGMMRQAAGHGYIMSEDRIHRLDEGMLGAINNTETDADTRQALEYARQTGDYRDMVQMGTDRNGQPVMLYGKSPNEWSPWQLAVERVRSDRDLANTPGGQIMRSPPEPNVGAQLAWERLTMRYAEDNGYYGRFGLPATYNSHSYNSHDIRTGVGSYRNALTQAYNAAQSDIRANNVDLLQHYGYVK